MDGYGKQVDRRLESVELAKPDVTGQKVLSRINGDGTTTAGTGQVAEHGWANSLEAR